MNDEKPNPGSFEAVEQGCSCPVFDNAHGKGAWGKSDAFWITPGCPLHAYPPKEAPDEQP